MDAAAPDPRTTAVETGNELLEILRAHIANLEAGTDEDDAAVDIDRRLWEAFSAYGDALDDLYDDEDDEEAAEPEEITFTVRTRYDYTVIDEKAFLSAGQGVGAAVVALLERAGGKPISALEVASLETGSGLLTVHRNDEPLVAADFAAAEEPTDLLLIDPSETLAHVLDEPVYGSRAEAEAAAKQRTD
jgi:hypothetical protein